MTIHDEIAKLPEWPAFPEWMHYEDQYPAESVRLVIFQVDDQERERYMAKLANAALARLALAREWVSGGHISICQYEMTGGQYPCDCGRDALLAALEVPK